MKFRQRWELSTEKVVSFLLGSILAVVGFIIVLLICVWLVYGLVWSLKELTELVESFR